ncbi:MAG: carboxypeptidase M32 [Erysipelotrichaceae bacterium]|nr:carboxypeptidase M32 [Erysipelotrichaceae bacterium]
MNKEEALRKYEEWRKKINAYNAVMNLAYFDKETVAPRDAADKRNEVLNYMSGEIYDIETDPELIKAVECLKNEDLGELLNREIYFVSKSLDDVTKFTKEETMEYQKACLDAWETWYKGKKDNDYSVFAPSLKKLIELQKYRCSKRNPDKKAYDVLLDDFEESMSVDKYEPFFKLIKEEIIPLIKIVNTKRDEVDNSFLHKYYPADIQRKFAKDLLHYLHFEGWGYMGETEHPFTDGIFRDDVRITTRYDEHNIASTIFSIIHETGHAYYEHQIDPKYDGSPVCMYISSGMHESQSRFLENYIGRSKAFWVNLYPVLQSYFHENLGDVSLDDFIRGINASGSSLIRTEADELTYPVHILIRYEIEKGIFDGSISTDNLNVVWNEMYKKYLDIDVPGDDVGILQDVHWSNSSFGYFPTYALGSAIGAQLYKTMCEKMDVNKCLTEGNFMAVEEYLKENVQYDGAMHDYNYILKRATGEEFNPSYYIDYLKNKYKELYNIK